MNRLHWRYLARYRRHYRALFTYLGCRVAQSAQGKYNTCRCRQRYRGRYRAMDHLHWRDFAGNFALS